MLRLSVAVIVLAGALGLAAAHSEGFIPDLGDLDLGAIQTHNVVGIPRRQLRVVGAKVTPPKLQLPEFTAPEPPKFSKALPKLPELPKIQIPKFGEATSKI
jgi:hypothetical protein